MRLPLSNITRNPNQPRQEFDQASLDELAASMAQNGLLQPIKIRSMGKDKPYMIVMGERRFRAAQQLGWETIQCNVVKVDDETMQVQAIIENLQREDLMPLEEAQSYQAMLDTGLTVEELAEKLGLRQAWRITERTSLLNLLADYQTLMKEGGLSNSQAFELSRLPKAKQPILYNLINKGKALTYSKLRACANEILEPQTKEQTGFDLPALSAEEINKSTGFEKKLEKVALLIADSYKDGEIQVLRKVNPGNLHSNLEKVKLMQKHLADMQKALESGILAEEVKKAEFEVQNAA